MEIKKDFITDPKGSIKSVVIDYRTFKAIEEVLLDQGLVKAMQEVEEDDELSLAEALELSK